MQKKLILDQNLLEITISRLCYQLIENHNDFSNSAILGLQPRGKFVADRIKSKLETLVKRNVQIGYLDTTFHRDDFRRRETPKKANETTIPFFIEDKKRLNVFDPSDSCYPYYFKAGKQKPFTESQVIADQNATPLMS